MSTEISTANDAEDGSGSLIVELLLDRRIDDQDMICRIREICPSEF